MAHKILVEITEVGNITLELDSSNSPKTVDEFIKNLPFSAQLNIWGEEIYTSETPIKMKEENAKTHVTLNDVAYWPTGKAICLFYGPTPIGNSTKITPASPVNIIGKIINPDKSILSKVEGKTGRFSLM